MLKKHISIFEVKIGKSQKNLTKRQDEFAKNQQKFEGAKIYEQDIYELDFLHSSMTDFLNNLEISLHKLSHFEQELEGIRQN